MNVILQCNSPLTSCLLITGVTAETSEMVTFVEEQECGQVPVGTVDHKKERLHYSFSMLRPLCL